MRHTIYGTRFGSEAVMGGEGLLMVNRILGHTQAQTTANCAHLADARRRAIPSAKLRA